MIEYIDRNIFIGNSRDAVDVFALKRNRIGAIINCAEEIPVGMKGKLPYLHIYWRPNQPITPDMSVNVYAFLRMNDTRNILVHCHEGIERSPAVCILIFMLLGKSFEESYRLVKNARTEHKIRIYPIIKKSLKELFNER